VLRTMTLTVQNSTARILVLARLVLPPELRRPGIR
jgi:hypothetical protein